ncbi:slit homolog 1 protein-like [Stegodyphus dumicola]|uniref:slit homolog 1 protein-like n=1 Tax=Stegodyphus dumicola TaxID=202533 RepID=UPI0015ACE369|nr:slit homolog 1 protein-like [Stegodyphus dumicola]
MVAWLFSIFLALASCLCTKAACPMPRTIHPCTCETMTDETGDDFSIIHCHNLHSEEDLTRILAATKKHIIFELQLVDCILRYLPHSAFEDTTFEVFSIHNSTLRTLSDDTVAFKGLEKNLHLIEVINCTFVSDWDWSQLQNLKHLMEIHVSHSELVDLTDSISKIQHLDDIEGFSFTQNKIEVLEENVFAPFFFLQRLTLDHNYIKQLKRSMLPSRAEHLQILGLSYNYLKTLPADMFLGMPALRSLYLTGNPLYTIDEAVFKPVWNQLHLFLFYGTPLSCDCRLIWLTKADNSKKFIHAECYGPASFKGRPLHSVQPHELWC